MDILETPTNIWQKIWKWIDHNPFLTLAFVFCIAFGIWGGGCQGTAFNPETGEEATAAQLNAAGAKAVTVIEDQIAAHRVEAQVHILAVTNLGAKADRLVENFNTAIEEANLQTEERNKMWAGMTQLATDASTAAGFPVGGVLAALLIGGLGGDNLRKGAKIKRDKNASGATS